MTGHSNHTYYPPLTGIRALAAYLLFAYHFNPFAVDRSPFLFHFFNEWHIGVSLFFVLSGFLIAMRYEAPIDRFHWKGYLVQRFARIFPLFFILTSLTFFYNSFFSNVPFDAKTFVANITLVKGFSERWLFTGIAQSWSLTVEECFYLSAPLIFWISRKIPLWIQPLTLFCTALAIAIVFGSPSPFTSFPVLYTFLGRSFEFYVGIHLAHKIRKDGHAIGGTLYTYGAIAFILATLLLTTFIGMEAIDSLHRPIGVVINLLLLPIGFAFLLFGLIREHSRIRAFLSTSIMQQLGKSSYAFYLIHIGVIQVLISTYLTDNTIILFVLLNAVAWGLFHWVERPLQRSLTNPIL